MIWLERGMAGTFHRESLALFGGGDGLPDEGLLLSALARPQNVFLAMNPTLMCLGSRHHIAMAL
jgi:death on curing protein